MSRTRDNGCRLRFIGMRSFEWATQPSHNIFQGNDAFKKVRTLLIPFAKNNQNDTETDNNRSNNAGNLNVLVENEYLIHKCHHDVHRTSQ